jgi:uncharacterized protein YndB with AHSA1/START domain
MKLLLVLAPLAVGIVAAITFVVVAGALMPRQHTASRSIRLAAAPEAVWTVITDFASHASWRGGVKSMERLPDRNGHPVWKEVGGWGDGMPLEVEAFDPPRRMVTRIASDALPFGGTWTYELTAESGGTRLRITEDGFVKPAAFRYIARVMGHASTIEQYLTSLARKLGDKAEPEA